MVIHFRIPRAVVKAPLPHEGSVFQARFYSPELEVQTSSSLFGEDVQSDIRQLFFLQQKG